MLFVPLQHGRANTSELQIYLECIDDINISTINASREHGKWIFQIYFTESENVKLELQSFIVCTCITITAIKHSSHC